MRWGVLSDIHGNWEALDTALKRLRTEGAQKYIFCGDLIGYGPDPEKCVQTFCRLKDAGKALGVLGNHDAIFNHPELREYFNLEALHSLDWSAKQMTPASLRCIAFLPEVIQEKNFEVVHGSPLDPIKEYFASARQYRSVYDLWKGQVLFVGHTHLPFYMQGDENACHIEVVRTPLGLSLAPMLRYVINPGSVGKPRDNDTRASFGLWDDKENTFYFLREEYDFTQTQDKMRATGMDDFLIDSLALGM